MLRRNVKPFSRAHIPDGMGTDRRTGHEHGVGSPDIYHRVGHCVSNGSHDLPCPQTAVGVRPGRTHGDVANISTEGGCASQYDGREDAHRTSTPASTKVQRDQARRWRGRCASSHGADRPQPTKAAWQSRRRGRSRAVLDVVHRKLNACSMRGPFGDIVGAPAGETAASNARGASFRVPFTTAKPAAPSVSTLPFLGMPSLFGCRSRFT